MRTLHCLLCRAQFVKWAQTYDYPVHGRWERLQLVHCSSCGWEPPVLGWAAREAAVAAYCDALHNAARQCTQAAASTAAASSPADLTHASTDGPSQQSSAPCSPQAGGLPYARPAKASEDQQRSEDGTAAAPAASRQPVPGRPGFGGLSLCLFRRVAKGETVFRRD